MEMSTRLPTSELHLHKKRTFILFQVLWCVCVCVGVLPQAAESTPNQTHHELRCFITGSDSGEFSQFGWCTRRACVVVTGTDTPATLVETAPEGLV